VAAPTTNYLYDGANVIREQRTGSPTVGYLTGGVDEIFARQIGTSTTAYLTDGLGSTVGLVDSTGAVATKYSYGPFGTTSTEGAADANPFQLTGREHDETGLYHYRARYYSPELSRFLSEDPLGVSSGDPNLYAYVANSPTNGTDPSGLCATGGQGLALLADDFQIFGTWMGQMNDLHVQFASGAISPHEYAAAVGTAAHAAINQVSISVAMICGPLLAGAFGIGPSPAAGGAGGFVDPADVRFTQSDISQTFRDGRSVSDLASGLKSGAIDPASVPPIRLVERDGALFSLDNRRLVAFGEAGVEVPYRMATPDEIRRQLTSKMTTKTNGRSIQLRFW
ncbi:MAG TPA: RHS repeat-associated core domain-containing protein, partial [Acidimicrobiales bacterium]